MDTAAGNQKCQCFKWDWHAGWVGGGRKLRGFGPRLPAAESQACLATCGSRCLMRRTVGTNIICLSLAQRHLHIF